MVRFNQFGHERCDCPVACTDIYTHRPGRLDRLIISDEINRKTPGKSVHCFFGTIYINLSWVIELLMWKWFIRFDNFCTWKHRGGRGTRYNIIVPQPLLQIDINMVLMIFGNQILQSLNHEVDRWKKIIQFGKTWTNIPYN